MTPDKKAKKLRHVPVGHEQGTAHTVDADARLTGKACDCISAGVADLTDRPTAGNSGALEAALPAEPVGESKAGQGR
jgi:hypothetical protein